MKSATPVPERRPDPFAVPSGTTLRFALLVLSTTAVVMSFAAGRFGHPWSGDEGMRRMAAYQACWERENRNTRGFPSGDRPPADEMCGEDPRLVELWVPATAVLVFWLLVFVIYWYLPAWRIRRRRYVPLGDQLPEAARAVEALRGRARTEPVSWYVQPLDPRVSALAFGRWRRRHIVLSGGLLALRTGQPGTFEAVVLHELAHVRNRDIDISFLTIVAGRVGLPVLLLTLPTGIGWPLLWSRTAGSLVSGAANSLQTLCLIVVIPLARRAVLRSREFYADARAQQWTTSPGALRTLFDVRDARRRLTGHLLRVHPTAGRRRAMLDDTAPLFRSGFWELFAVGCVLGALYTELTTTFVLNSALGARADIAKGLLADVVTGMLCGAVVGFLALRTNEGFPGARPRVLWAPAWGLGCGLALGGGVVNSGTAFALVTAGQWGVGFVPWAGLLALASYVAARWMSGVVRLWRPALPHRRRPVLTLCGLTGAVGLLFACVLHWLMELMVAEALMAKIIGSGTPEIVAFVLGAGMDAVANAPYLLCAAALAALVPLLGQSLSPDADAGARLELRRTLGGGVRWGLWLMAGMILLDFASSGTTLWFLPVAGALVVLAVRTGRRPRGTGLAFAHAVLASSLAGVLAIGGAAAALALLDCWSGRCSIPNLPRTARHIGFSAIPWLVIAACVPSVRKGRAPRIPVAPAVPPTGPRP